MTTKTTKNSHFRVVKPGDPHIPHTFLRERKERTKEKKENSPSAPLTGEENQKTHKPAVNIFKGAKA
jgi:hypothetical protein